MAMEQQDLSRMLETAIVSARLAGQRATEQMDFASSSVKNDRELVTDIDLYCQRLIVERIKQTYPDHGFIAEEQEDNNIFKQPPRGSEAVWWIIDPIDGTNNFAHRIPLFTVSIAAMYQDEPIVAAIFAPSTESMFTAVKGGDAKLNGRRITANEDKIGQFSSIGLDSHFGSPIPRWVSEIMQRTRFRVIGSAALQLAYVAKGGLIGAISTSCKLWDIAAGALICSAAGAIVTDRQGAKVFPLMLDDYDGGEIPVIAANHKVHTELMTILKS